MIPPRLLLRIEGAAAFLLALALSGLVGANLQRV